ncbi:MAG TPA: hypothetical protein VMM84_09665 [Pyrinomonadaceae bacterium]|nr:hypothetical protein [Pyrinomonadaceae bacterium]
MSEGVYLLPFPETESEPAPNIALEIPSSYDPSVPGKIAAWQNFSERKESNDRSSFPVAESVPQRNVSPDHRSLVRVNERSLHAFSFSIARFFGRAPPA